MRISKSCLVNLLQIKSLRNDVERKIRLTLKNGEQIVVSRQYADEMKKEWDQSEEAIEERHHEADIADYFKNLF